VSAGYLRRKDSAYKTRSLLRTPDLPLRWWVIWTAKLLQTQWTCFVIPWMKLWLQVCLLIESNTSSSAESGPSRTNRWVYLIRVMPNWMDCLLIESVGLHETFDLGDWDCTNCNRLLIAFCWVGSVCSKMSCSIQEASMGKACRVRSFVRQVWWYLHLQVGQTNFELNCWLYIQVRTNYVLVWH